MNAKTFSQQMSDVRVQLFGAAPKARRIRKSNRIVVDVHAVNATHNNVNSVTFRFPKLDSDN